MRQAGQRSNGRNTYVAPVELAPEEVRDATEMIRYRYDTGTHLSRRKSNEIKRWSDRDAGSQPKTKVAARLVMVNGSQPAWIPQTLDEALRTFAEYMLHAKELSAPQSTRRSA